MIDIVQSYRTADHDINPMYLWVDGGGNGFMRARLVPEDMFGQCSTWVDCGPARTNSVRTALDQRNAAMHAS